MRRIDLNEIFHFSKSICMFIFISSLIIMFFRYISWCFNLCKVWKISTFSEFVNILENSILCWFLHNLISIEFLFEARIKRNIRKKRKEKHFTMQKKINWLNFSHFVKNYLNFMLHSFVSIQSYQQIFISQTSKISHFHNNYIYSFIHLIISLLSIHA